VKKRTGAQNNANITKTNRMHVIIVA